jgi:hypothetical protein
MFVALHLFSSSVCYSLYINLRNKRIRACSLRQYKRHQKSCNLNCNSYDAFKFTIKDVMCFMHMTHVVFPDAAVWVHQSKIILIFSVKYSIICFSLVVFVSNLGSRTCNKIYTQNSFILRMSLIINVKVFR